jgi:hypothetical protein
MPRSKARCKKGRRNERRCLQIVLGNARQTRNVSGRDFNHRVSLAARIAILTASAE